MRKLKAFTILEVVIALAILIIGLVGILSLFPVGFNASRRASMLTKATIYAQQKMEDIKRAGYSNLPASGPPSGWIYFKDTDDNDIDLEWQTTVSADIPPGNLKMVTLEVRWKEKGVYNVEKFVTYIAKLK